MAIRQAGFSFTVTHVVASRPSSPAGSHPQILGTDNTSTKLRGRVDLPGASGLGGRGVESWGYVSAAPSCEPDWRPDSRCVPSMNWLPVAVMPVVPPRRKATAPLSV